MGILNIDRGSYQAAGLAEHLAEAITNRSDAMFGRRREPVSMLNSHLLHWLQFMELKYSGWLDMLLPSLGIVSLLPHLFSRFRDEMDITPLAMTWFDPDWVQYLGSQGPDMGGPGAVSGDRVPGKHGGLLPAGVRANAFFIRNMINRLTARSSAAPLLDGGFLMPGAVGLHGSPGVLDSVIHKAHYNVSPRNDYSPLPLSITESGQLFSVPSSNTMELPVIPGVAALQQTGELPQLPLLAMVLPTIEQVINGRYLSPRSQAAASGYFSGAKLAIARQPSILSAIALAASITAKVGPEGRRDYDVNEDSLPLVSERRTESKKENMPGASINETDVNDENGSSPLLPGRNRAAVPKLQRNEVASYGRMPFSAEHISSLNYPGVNTSADFVLPGHSRGQREYVSGYGKESGKSGGPAFSGLENMLAEAGIEGPASVTLPHAPAAFVQKKASSPEASQETSEQPARRESSREQSEAGQDMETLAAEIYDILRRRILVEQERLQGTAG